MIVCKSPAEIERMRAANALVAEVLAELARMVAPGVTTRDLDARAEKLVRDAFIWSHLAGDTVQRLKVAGRLARMAATH